MSFFVIVAEPFFWIGCGWLLYIYVGYPLCLLLLQLRSTVRPATSENYLPKVSVVVAARNEENDIERSLRVLLSWDYPPDRLEVLIASDASTDRTDDIIRSIQDSRLKFYRMEPRGGKNLALNHLISKADGELLFFTDANTRIEAGCLRRVVRHFADPRVGCVTGEMKYVSGDVDPALTAGERAYWGFESVLKRLESRLGSVLVCVGSVFCCRRSLFTTLDPELANDMETPVRIGDRGSYVLYEPAAQSVEQASATPWEEFSRRKRICAQGILGMWKLRKNLRGLRGWQFVSRKLMRWLTLVPLGMLLLSSLMLASHNFFRDILILQLVIYAAALLGLGFCLAGKSGGKLLSVPFYGVLLIVAAFTGVLQGCRGKRFGVWEITRGLQSARTAGSDLYPCNSGEVK